MKRRGFLAAVAATALAPKLLEKYAKLSPTVSVAMAEHLAVTAVNGRPLPTAVIVGSEGDMWLGDGALWVRTKDGVRRLADV